MLLGAEIAMSVVGLYWLITGTARVSRTRELAGTRARVLGLILLLTFPLTLLLGLVMGLLIGIDVLPNALMPYLFLADVASIVLVLLASAAYSAAGKDRSTEAGSRET